ncbi:MAG: redox-sensing transcriptional repressor Rex [Candidatus Omnitrophota bacterium]|nr:MAG: redox-sensing transcriptional repressor Rex [Candidatus Omnitrophota bacterium]
MAKKIPEETILRLSHYLRALLYFLEEKKDVVSSRAIAEFLKISPHQLRKDLSYFGHFGKKGVGYSCAQLLEAIKEILGLNRNWYAAVVGFGNLGRALSFYKGFRDQGIFIKVAFDVDEKKTNRMYKGIGIYPLEKMEEVLKREKVQIGIVTVPKEVAEDIASRLSGCGIRAILNFAPLKLNFSHTIIAKDVDLSCQLSYLTYHLKTAHRDSPKQSSK